MKTILCVQEFAALCPVEERTSLGFSCPLSACYWLKEEDGVYVVEVRDGPDDDDDPEGGPGRLYGVYTIAGERAERLRVLLTTTSLPLTLGEDMPTGCDGSTTTLAFKKGGLGATYTWWSVIPPGWEPLVEIADIVLDFGGEEDEGDDKATTEY